MIVPMKKLTLLVLESEKEKALKKLRKVGVVHVEKQEANSETLTELNQIKSNFELCENLLADAMPKAVKKQKTLTPLLSEGATFDLVDEVLSLNERKTRLRESLNKLNNLLERYKEWGDFDPTDLDFLSENGVYLFPAKMEEKKYKKLNGEIRTLKLKSAKKQAYFLVWHDAAELPVDFDTNIELLPKPEKRISSLSEDYVNAQKEIDKIELRMAELSKNLNSVKAVYKINASRLEFESIRAGMPEVGVAESTKNFAEVKLAWLTGFIPSTEVEKIESASKENGWGFALSEPTEEDNVPTQLKNNKFVSIINPLFDFLDTRPGYFEVDVSFWFLMFFGVFVAMIFGDAAYGSLILIAVLFGIIKAKRAGKEIGNSLWLGLFLGSLITVWGVMTCSWFGIAPELLPDVLKTFAIKGISSLVPSAVRNRNIMLISFSLGLAHLSLAHFISLVKNIKSPRFLSDVGSILMLIPMFFVVLNMVIDPVKYQLNNTMFISLGIGFILNFMFANYTTSLGNSIIESLKNIVNMLLGVVNVFSDIMSYIRLWAVGLAGAAISMTVNTMCGPMLGKALLIGLGVLIFVFGHGLNIIMAVLSVLVHAVRLNNLEFSSHLGLTWSGFRYMPFAETEK
ncbi:MAG: V-type ATP synthase subunit I [Treponema sp.]|nr:MAG: V-type ATP synthase subunit I [Treponema sp.]